jgi:hypothetical protein
VKPTRLIIAAAQMKFRATTADNIAWTREALAHPAFLRAHWKAMLAACRRQLQSL